MRAVDAILADDSVVRDARIDLELLAAASASGEARLDALLEGSMRDAMAELERRLGRDPSRWSWGALHRARFAHPLVAAGLVDADALPLAREVPRGGGCDTVGNTAYGPLDLVQNVGATTRLVLDVGAWDEALAMNAPGQSGDPRSAHYDALLAAWADDDAVPLLFSREAVEAAVERRIVLSPRAPSRADGAVSLTGSGGVAEPG